jgi:diguanylate cyclase (GGDEF)-like protein/PAS domain S-box-containing protein
LSRIVVVRFAAAQIALLLVLALVGVVFYVRVQENRAQARLNEASTAIARQVDSYLLRHREGIENLSLSLETVPLSDRAAVAARLRRFHESFPSFRVLIATDAQGVIIAAYSSIDPKQAAAVVGQSVADRAYFREAMRRGREGYVSGVFRARGSDPRPILAVSAALWDSPDAPDAIASAAASPRGVIEASFSLEYFGEVVDIYRQIEGGEIVVLDGDGSVVYASAATGLAALDRAAWSVDEGLKRERPAAEPLFGHLDATASVPVADWTVVVRWPRLAVYRYAINWLGIAVLLVSVLVLAASALARAGALRAMAPLERLAQRLRNLAAESSSPGHLEDFASALRREVDLVVEGDRAVPLEVTELGGALAAFAEQLHGAQHSLQATLSERDRALASQRALLAELEDRVAERTGEVRVRAAILEAVAFSARAFLETGWQAGAAAALERLGRAAAASRAYVFENRRAADGQLLCSQRYEWVEQGISPQIDSPALQDLPYQAAGFGRWETILERGLSIHGLVADLPGSERSVLEQQGIRSLVVVPVLVDGSPWGFLGFDDCLADRTWAEPTIEALHAAARMLGAAVARERAEQALRSSETRYREIFEHGFGIVLTYTLEGKLLSINPAGARGFSGARPEDLLGRNLADVVPAAAREFVLSHLKRLPTESIGDGLVAVPGRDGGERVFSCRYRVLAEGGSAYVVAQALDVTEKRRAEAALEHRAHHDPLTGCANRSLFETRLEHAVSVARHRIESGDRVRVGVLFLDLDDFKRVNDEHGHLAGDRALREIGERFRLQIDGVDLVARLGGDEFAFVLYEVTELRQTEAVALSLLAVLQEPIRVGSLMLEVGASLGIALFPLHGDGVSEIVARADAAMYRAKLAGKNRFAYADLNP